MQRLVHPSCESVSLLGKKAPGYRLPSFRDGFSDWGRKADYGDAMRFEDGLEGGEGGRLPSVFAVLGRGWV